MTQQATATDEMGATTSLSRFIKSNIREYGMLLSLIVIMIFFQVMTGGTLFKPLNLTNLILQKSYIVIMALGMLLVIVAGHIDLSGGSVVGFVGAVAAVLMVQLHIHFIPAAIFCLALGAAIGAGQGYFIVYLKIPSFIVTLAGMLVFKGLALYILAGQSVGPFPKEFQLLSSGFLPNFLPGTFNTTSLIIGIVVTGLVIYFNFRDRQNQEKHGTAEEPTLFFIGRNILIAAGFLLFSYLLALPRGFASGSRRRM